MDRLPPNPLCYLATPYTKYKGGDIEAAFRDAARLAAKLMQANIKVYSPIVHCHPIAIHGGIDPLNATMWIAFDEAMMDAAHVLIVAHMDGWKESKGVAHEIEFFEKRGKPIFDLNPETMTMVKRQPVAPPRDRFDGAAPHELEADRRGFPAEQSASAAGRCRMISPARSHNSRCGYCRQVPHPDVLVCGSLCEAQACLVIRKLRAESFAPERKRGPQKRPLSRRDDIQSAAE